MRPGVENVRPESEHVSQEVGVTKMPPIPGWSRAISRLCDPVS